MKNIRKETANHNKEVLINDLKLIQYKNTSIFENNKLFVLSPSIRNSVNWFDFRDVIINRIDDMKKGVLLIRFFDNYILIDLKLFLNKMIDNNPYDTKNSGKHWKFKIEKKEGNMVIICNQRSKTCYDAKKLNKEEIINLLSN